MNIHLEPNEMRERFLVPIHVSCDGGVTEEEYEQAVRSIKYMVDLSGRNREIKSFRNGPWGKGDFSSGDWFLEQSDRRGTQVSFESLSSLFLMEPYQKAPFSHLEIFITSRDLFSEGMNFIFGGTIPNELTIQSVYRFREGNHRQTMILLDEVIRHEVGHLLGLPGLIVPSNHPRIYEKGGPHCSNLCQMRQSYSLRELKTHINEEAREKVTLCPDCLEELRQVQKQFVEFSLNI